MYINLVSNALIISSNHKVLIFSLIAPVFDHYIQIFDIIRSGDSIMVMIYRPPASL